MYKTEKQDVYFATLKLILNAIAKYLLFGKDLNWQVPNSVIRAWQKMITMNIFRSSCFIEDVIFLAAESIQKENMVTVSFMLRKYGLI